MLIAAVNVGTYLLVIGVAVFTGLAIYANLFIKPMVRELQAEEKHTDASLSRSGGQP